MSTEEQDSNHHGLNRRNVLLGSTTLAAASAFSSVASVRTAQAQQQQQQPAPAQAGDRPNILVIWGETSAPGTSATTTAA